MSRFRTSGRSVFDVIESEHRLVENIYSQIQALWKEGAERGSGGGGLDSSRVMQLCFMLIRDLSVHSHKEEILIYPLLTKVSIGSSSSTSEAAAQPQPSHACHEHVMVERQLLALETELEHSLKLSAPISNTAISILDSMMQDLLRHIEEEEKVLLPALRSAVPEEEAVRLGRLWESLTGRVATRPHPDAPTLGELAAAANAAQAPIDALQDEARFKHAMPTAPGAVTANALTPHEQNKLELPTDGSIDLTNPNLTTQPLNGTDSVMSD